MHTGCGWQRNKIVKKEGHETSLQTPIKDDIKNENKTMEGIGPILV